MKLDKQIRIDADVDLDRAFAAVKDFIRQYAATHHGRNHPVVYSWQDEGEIVGLVVWQTDHSYIVRKG